MERGGEKGGGEQAVAWQRCCALTATCWPALAAMAELVVPRFVPSAAAAERAAGLNRGLLRGASQTAVPSDLLLRSVCRSS